MDPNATAPVMGLTPSAPPPSAPPSYEEAMASSGMPMPQPTPYPVGPAAMPVPMPSGDGLGPQYPFGPSGMPMPIGHGKGPIIQAPMPGSCPSTSQSTAQPTVVTHHLVYALGPHPVTLMCRKCMAEGKTTTISGYQPSAHFCCIMLFFLGCCLCSCLPYCMNSFRNVHHFCPNCKSYIGTWKG